MEKNKKEIEMKVAGVLIDPRSATPVVLLKEVNGKKLLPIWIGPLEASSILVKLENVKIPRPLTHDLFVNFLKENNFKILKIVITELKENTYYARIYYKSRLKVKEIDARPSDAISIALRVQCPIYVNYEVLEASKFTESEESKENLKEFYKEFLEKLDKKDLGDEVM